MGKDPQQQEQRVQRAVEGLVNALIHPWPQTQRRSALDMLTTIAWRCAHSAEEKIGVPLPDDVIKNRVRSERRNYHRRYLRPRRPHRAPRLQASRDLYAATASRDAYRPFLHLGSNGEQFTVTLYNMDFTHWGGSQGLEVGTSCNTMPGISRLSSRRISLLKIEAGRELSSCRRWPLSGFSP